MKYYGKGERFIMHTMRLSRKLLHVSMAAAVTMSSFGMIPVIAEEAEEAEETAAESVEETEEAELTAEEETPVLEEVSSAPEKICEFIFPEENDLEIPKGTSIEDMKKQMPSSVQAIRTDKSVIDVPVTWTCVDQNGDQYDFTAVYDTAAYPAEDGVELPMIYVYTEEFFDVPEGHDSALDEFDVDEEWMPEIVESGDLLGAEYERSYRNTDLPEIRAQKPYGTCWAFAALGSAEADLIRDAKADKTVDLSELQLAYIASHGYTDPKKLHQGEKTTFVPTKTIKNHLDNGGNSVRAIRILANLAGAVKEEDVPYSNGHTYELPEKYEVSSDYAQLTGGYFIRSSDISGIKKAIKEHGGVVASMYAANGYPVNPKDGKKYEVRYNETTNAFYGTMPLANHDIMLVGWNDDFAKENFSQGCRPEHNGAWLVRNSWGKRGDGENINGYFWLSYEDKGLLSDLVAAYDMDTALHDYCYSYTGIPQPTNTLTVKNKGVLVQKYRISANEAIDMIGIEMGCANLDLVAEVTDGKNTSRGKCHMTFQGYYTIKLDTPLIVREDKEITVTITAEKKGDVVFLCEWLGPSKATAVTYTPAINGPGFTINGEQLKYDPYVKVYTNAVEPAPKPDPTPEPYQEAYRVYNPNSGEHFFTCSEEEHNALKNAGWKDEGIAFSVLPESGEPIYRLYNPNAGDHHYTVSKEECEMLKKAGWNYVGIAFHASEKGIPQYRLYNPNAECGAHLYTASDEERQALIKAGWNDEGIGFFTEK